MSLLHRKRSLFQRLMFLGLMALVLSTALTLTTGVASAKTASPTRAATTYPYDGQNPISTGCYKDAQTERSNTGIVIWSDLETTYTISLNFSYVCHTSWAKIVLDSVLPLGYQANAIVTRNNDERQYDCTTGNGVVLAGQTSCYSGMVYDGAGFSAYAAAMFLKIGSTWQSGAHTLSF